MNSNNEINSNSNFGEIEINNEMNLSPNTNFGVVWNNWNTFEPNN